MLAPFLLEFLPTLSIPPLILTFSLSLSLFPLLLSLPFPPPSLSPFSPPSLSSFPPSFSLSLFPSFSLSLLSPLSLFSLLSLSSLSPFSLSLLSPLSLSLLSLSPFFPFLLSLPSLSPFFLPYPSPFSLPSPPPFPILSSPPSPFSLSLILLPIRSLSLFSLPLTPPSPCRCDQLTGDSSGEAESWANAARQFLLAEDQLYQARNASYQDMIEAAIQCFLLAIHVSRTLFYLLYMYSSNTVKHINKYKTLSYYYYVVFAFLESFSSSLMLKMYYNYR